MSGPFAVGQTVYWGDPERPYRVVSANQVVDGIVAALVVPVKPRAGDPPLVAAPIDELKAEPANARAKAERLAHRAEVRAKANEAWAHVQEGWKAQARAVERQAQAAPEPRSRARARPASAQPPQPTAQVQADETTQAQAPTTPQTIGWLQAIAIVVVLGLLLVVAMG